LTLTLTLTLSPNPDANPNQDPEHLALIDATCGAFPKHMLEESVDKGGELAGVVHRVFGRGLGPALAVNLSEESASAVRRQRRIRDGVGKSGRDAGLDELLSALLTIDPGSRVTAAEALSLSFCMDRPPESVASDGEADDDGGVLDMTAVQELHVRHASTERVGVAERGRSEG